MHYNIVVMEYSDLLWTIESLEFTDDGSYGTQPSSNYKIRSNSWTRKIIAWVLVVILAVLLIVSLAINVIQAIWTRRSKETGMASISPNRAVAMDSNPCYVASNVKQTEAQEAALHVYKMVKQHN